MLYNRLCNLPKISQKKLFYNSQLLRMLMSTEYLHFRRKGFIKILNIQITKQQLLHRSISLHLAEVGQGISTPSPMKLNPPVLCKNDTMNVHSIWNRFKIVSLLGKTKLIFCYASSLIYKLRYQNEFTCFKKIVYYSFCSYYF